MTRAFVYWNIRKRVFSVRVRGRVIAHATRVLIEDVQFRVSESGRARVLSTGHKNVHATIYGYLVACGGLSRGKGDHIPGWAAATDKRIHRIKESLVPVRYNPYESGEFMAIGSGRAVHTAALVYCRANRLTGRPDVYVAE